MVLVPDPDVQCSSMLPGLCKFFLFSVVVARCQEVGRPGAESGGLWEALQVRLRGVARSGTSENADLGYSTR